MKIENEHRVEGSIRENLTSVRLKNQAMRMLPPILSANASPISSAWKQRPSQLNIERSKLLDSSLSPPVKSRFAKVKQDKALHLEDFRRDNDFSD